MLVLLESLFSSELQHTNCQYTCHVGFLCFSYLMAFSAGWEKYELSCSVTFFFFSKAAVLFLKIKWFKWLKVGPGFFVVVVFFLLLVQSEELQWKMSMSRHTTDNCCSTVGWDWGFLITNVQGSELPNAIQLSGTNNFASGNLWIVHRTNIKALDSSILGLYEAERIFQCSCYSGSRYSFSGFIYYISGRRVLYKVTDQ